MIFGRLLNNLRSKVTDTELSDNIANLLVAKGHNDKAIIDLLSSIQLSIYGARKGQYIPIDITLPFFKCKNEIEQDGYDYTFKEVVQNIDKFIEECANRIKRENEDAIIKFKRDVARGKYSHSSGERIVGTGKTLSELLKEERAKTSDEKK